MFYKKKGFTLLELMIVVVIVGVLASLAIPRFISAKKNAVKAEAYNILGAIRSSQMRYYMLNDEEYATTASNLDLTTPTSSYFNYVAADNTSASTYCGKATGISGTIVDSAEVQIAVDGTKTESGF